LSACAVARRQLPQSAQENGERRVVARARWAPAARFMPPTQLTWRCP
jgi:hypothetical protein